jgi:hypothetical protein
MSNKIAKANAIKKAKENIDIVREKVSIAEDKLMTAWHNYEAAYRYYDGPRKDALKAEKEYWRLSRELNAIKEILEKALAIQ